MNSKTKEIGETHKHNTTNQNYKPKTKFKKNKLYMASRFVHCRKNIQKIDQLKKSMFLETE